jgi:hypothetical protein
MLDSDPPLDRQALAAVSLALARAGVQVEQRPAAYSSPWRRTAAREAVEGTPARSAYALSPRRTRGATRA